jgi:hypothetical protein
MLQINWVGATRRRVQNPYGGVAPGWPGDHRRPNGGEWRRSLVADAGVPDAEPLAG